MTRRLVGGAALARARSSTGSSLNEVLKRRVTRPYMDPNSPYSKGVDAQWFCHRGPAAIGGFRISDSDAPAAPPAHHERLPQASTRPAPAPCERYCRRLHT